MMPTATLRGVILDCADPNALARFYQALTGMPIGFSTDEFVALTGGAGCDLASGGRGVREVQLIPGGGKSECIQPGHALPLRTGALAGGKPASWEMRDHGRGL